MDSALSLLCWPIHMLHIQVLSVLAFFLFFDIYIYIKDIKDIYRYDIYFQTILNIIILKRIFHFYIMQMQPKMANNYRCVCTERFRVAQGKLIHI